MINNPYIDSTEETFKKRFYNYKISLTWKNTRKVPGLNACKTQEEKVLL